MANTLDILFHDEDPLNGHFEPLVCTQPTIGCTFQQQTNVSYEQDVVMFHSAHSSKNNTEAQPETKCQSVETKLKPSRHLNKHSKSVSLHVLKDIAQKDLKRQKIGIDYNKIAMKQQDVSQALRFQSLRNMSTMSEEHKLQLLLQKHHLFRVNNFAYLIGDCLFDSLEVLLDFQYT